MNINELYELTRDDSKYENRLIECLNERFSLILQHRVYEIEDRQDLLQDTVMAILSKYKSIDFKISFSAWAYKVLDNNLMNYYRNKATARRKKEQMQNENIYPTVINPDPIVKHKLLNCYKKLLGVNKRYAEVISLHYHGYKVEEICEKLDISTNNMYIILSRARSLLRDCLESGDL